VYFVETTSLFLSNTISEIFSKSAVPSCLSWILLNNTSSVADVFSILNSANCHPFFVAVDFTAAPCVELPTVYVCAGVAAAQEDCNQSQDANGVTPSLVRRQVAAVGVIAVSNI
jgi:hypothetical protein